MQHNCAYLIQQHVQKVDIWIQLLLCSQAYCYTTVEGSSAELCANIKLDTIEACVAKYEMAFLLFFFGRPTASSLFFGQVVYTGY